MNSEVIEQNKALYRQFLQQVFNEGKLEMVDELLSPDYVLHDPQPGTPPGREAVERIATTFRNGLPDLTIAIDDLVAVGDKVCVRATTRGTHKGTIFGVPATGKFVAISGLTMVRIADGRIAESWVRNDVIGLMKQIGGASK